MGFTLLITYFYCLPKSESNYKQQRLVSLDVFHGLTVVVLSFFFFIFLAFLIEFWVLIVQSDLFRLIRNTKKKKKSFLVFRVISSIGYLWFTELCYYFLIFILFLYLWVFKCDNPITSDPSINKLTIYLLKYNSYYVNLLFNLMYFNEKTTSN